MKSSIAATRKQCAHAASYVETEYHVLDVVSLGRCHWFLTVLAPHLTPGNFLRYSTPRYALSQAIFALYL